ncbi:acyl carrier protein [Candidatus Scalindua japonica]|uniref:Acyl carrier protein n=2 Tax=Candidatus Scalindua japonica TaxID=1284222 RepID=A0A286U081_9BACT|nr:acyl carrier protein [Candidatus Scalindua japonica]GAX61528.1 acyl carrier protein [Candidatus Scalindua japonica]
MSNMFAKKPNIEEMIMEIVEKQMSVNRERITHETAFINDLGADSLDLAELHMEIEVAFDLEISNEDAEMILTFGDAVDYINEHT